ncbi:LOW QUALITY PROTEIN: hypothetical protein MCAG_01228, partial [Micromonospora sp. ATCC 39149]
ARRAPRPDHPRSLVPGRRPRRGRLRRHPRREGPAPGGRAARSPAAARRRVRGAQPVQAGLPPVAGAAPGAGRGQLPGGAAAAEHVPPAHRHAAAGGPAAVRPGQPAPRGAGAARRAPGQLGGVHGPRGRAWPVRGGSAGGPAHRPVRAVRAEPVVPQRGPAHGDPAGHPAALGPAPGEYAGSGSSRARSVAVHGEDDAATREYRMGDDLRRVHWKSTARTGELMVRREEQPWESRATVVLDTRGYGHHGDGPTASFEWAVSAAASIAVHLRQAGYKLRLVTGDGADVDATEGAGDGLLLDQLAEVRLDPRGDITTLVQQVRQRGDGGLIIGLFGTVSTAEAELLAGLRGNGATCVGFLLDSSTWLHLPPRARAEADHAHGAAALALLQSGWRVVGVDHGARLPALWPQAGRGSQGFALRAALAETVAGGVK